ncbi:MAG: S8 family serine peptidase [Bacteroidia bacterium]|nr:S8 family serine peptidase [Bacteroidia bacterium]MDW8133582.1 S8 family serine peptidase [Bacteroidia bacterium]
MWRLYWGLRYILVAQAVAQSNLYLTHFHSKPESLLLSAERFLSPFSLQRRIEQGIPIDLADAPIPTHWIDTLKRYGKVWGYSRWLNAALMELGDARNMPKAPFILCIEPFSHVPVMGVSAVSRLEKVTKPEKSSTLVNAIQLNQLGILSLHNRGYEGSGVRIAILDAGFPFMNQIPAFQGVFQGGRYLGGYDFVSGDSTIFEDNSHGTQVSSVIVANDSLLGYKGGAPKATILLARTENALSESRVEEWNWVRAAEWADSIGVHIIQSSLGYSTFDNPAEDYTYADMNGRTAITTRAALLAARKGILVVNSAGNEGNSGWRYITAPADADSILAVGAVNQNGEIAFFSSRGPTSDGRPKPDVVAMGLGTYIVGISGQVQQSSGTSFAAPLITSLAACLWEAYPRAHAQEIREAIISSADRNASPDSLYGYGIPNGEIALSRLAALISPEAIKHQFHVYPNPAQEEIRVFLHDPHLRRYWLSIYNRSGECLYSMPYRGHTELPITISMLSRGLYFIQLLEEGGNATFVECFIKL